MEDYKILEWLFYASCVGFVIKQFINLIQIKNSVLRLIVAEEVDDKKIN